eukprot:956370-Pelagomonas_calceolata.AAC.6
MDFSCTSGSHRSRITIPCIFRERHTLGPADKPPDPRRVINYTQVLFKENAVRHIPTCSKDLHSFWDTVAQLLALTKAVQLGPGRQSDAARLSLLGRIQVGAQLNRS